MLPGFLIVGTQRGGTTSLYRALSQHPLVAKPLWHKGIHYFDLHYDRGPGSLPAHFPPAAAGRETGAARWLTFESSPYYMLHPLAGARIGRDLPDVKLLALVRDPVERAYSAHAHEIARGYESEPFERALELEPERLAGEVERMTADPGYRSHSLQHQSYIHRGQYADQLERLEALVGRDRLHVIDSGDFFGDPAPVYDRVVEFLGLPDMGRPEFDRHNARPRGEMADDLRLRLDEHFRLYDARLERWLGGAPSWRRQERS